MSLIQNIQTRSKRCRIFCMPLLFIVLIQFHHSIYESMIFTGVLPILGEKIQNVMVFFLFQIFYIGFILEMNINEGSCCMLVFLWKSVLIKSKWMQEVIAQNVSASQIVNFLNSNISWTNAWTVFFFNCFLGGSGQSFTGKSKYVENILRYSKTV